MNTEPESLMFKCGLEPVERSLRQAHLKTEEQIVLTDVNNPFYEIEAEKMKKEKAVE